MPSAHRSPQYARTVLIVDPDLATRKALRRALAREDYRVLDSASGREALALMQRMGGPVHVLITELVLPDTDGLSLAGRVAARRPIARVIIVSSECSDVICIIRKWRVACISRPSRSAFRR